MYSSSCLFYLNHHKFVFTNVFVFYLAQKQRESCQHFLEALKSDQEAMYFYKLPLNPNQIIKLV